MQIQTRFSALLDELWHRRTRDIRRLVGAPNPGPNRRLCKGTRDRILDDLLDTAMDILEYRKRAGVRRKFEAVTERCRRARITGRGFEKKSAHLLRWIERKTSGSVVYSWWRGNACLYVGSGETTGRLRGYIKNKCVYIQCATTIRVHEVPRLFDLVKAECLAVHLFNPRDNKNYPSQKKWRGKCPVCKDWREVKKELKFLFRAR